jgi:hypothetical protein
MAAFRLPREKAIVVWKQSALIEANQELCRIIRHLGSGIVFGESPYEAAKNARSPLAGKFLPVFWTLHALFKSHASR